MQVTSPNERTIVRPVFAAWVFGFCSVLLFLTAGLVLAFAHISTTTLLLAATSILSPAVPLIYFAVRGFRRGRRSAFDDLSEPFCLRATGALAALAVVLGVLAGNWAFTVGPAVAAVLFACCIRSVREFLMVFS